MSNLESLLDQVDDMRDEIIALEQALVRIPTVNTGFMPTGNETEACRYIEKWLSEDSIASETIESAPDRGNLIARLKGKSGKAGLMFMSHLDVVPVEEEEKWRFPPFSATVADGRIFGRGASDCKALLTCQLVAMRLLKRNNIELKDDLILASCADEEHGGRYGFGWMAEHHPEKLDAPYAVNEGGGVPISAAGALTYLLGIGEKGRLQLEIEVRGSSAHASTPWQGSNALFGLSEVVKRIEAYEAERDTSTSLFDHLSTFAIEDKPSPENIDQIIADHEENQPRFTSIMKALSRMTITPTMINGGIKSNSVPESVRLTCDVRTLPHQDEAYVRQELGKILEGIDGVEIDVDYMSIPNASEFDTEFASRIQISTARALGRDDIQWVPSLSTGFTDSRFTRNLGTTTYGMVGSHPDDDPMLSFIHGTNESVGIRSLVSGTRIMLALAYDVLAAN
ncbi:MAG: M20/M25/M40 family metallo-hydrolase [Chloroflexota bacterium]|jgi:acetylornithine deacetylase/succinyl-diaminopimelate desuccinylase-like protein|nr:MAG: M20/M25/M40 family metallo-hydrolase [SAR202 cluster bacterium]MCH2671439.1 M20/M25/M40 family metallo-hydrolase [Dehalococcoidia bacterium]MEE3015102.1 M20/M25/M40 family metallo-hydrolase [Chloroflexota bacterium]|tara:strand:+ start:7915 stop:9273 length:1359 start_codon:yes stop_codon:yes gene_type:complete